MSKVKTLPLGEFITLFNNAIREHAEAIAANDGNFVAQNEHIEKMLHLSGILHLGMLAPTDTLYIMALRNNLIKNCEV